MQTTTKPAEAVTLSVSLSAIARDHTGIVEVCDDQPELADGFGVYIRAPLAMHVTDFDIPGHLFGNADVRALTLSAAFAYADGLAEHLGGVEVQSNLPRPLAPVSALDIAEAAACLWEAAMEMRSLFDNELGAHGRDVLAPWKVDFLEAWDDGGTSALRMRCVDLAERCHREWQAEHDAGKFDGPFDWEWCPDWLARELENQWSTAHREIAEMAEDDDASTTGNGRAMVPGDIVAGEVSCHVLNWAAGAWWTQSLRNGGAN